jgi:hypothetical protein
MSQPVDIPALPDACWPVDWGCADQAWVQGLDPVVKARSEAMAVQVLRSLTGYQVGGCPVAARPCAVGCAGGSYLTAPVVSGATGALGARVGPWWAHVGLNGMWVNTACGCATACSCTYVPEVILPAPVGGVVDVTIDGAVLDPSAYRVDDGNRLVRTDGGIWPRCQDMAADLGQPGTFGVVYYNGYPVDGLGSWVAGIMAVEFAKSCIGDKCRLPSGVTSISRMGVSMEIPSSLFDDGLTGIREVDMWVRVWNPHRLKSASQVWSPDLPGPRARRTTWSATGGAP